jgi:tetratricopeptide (TPR) repeat protein
MRRVSVALLIAASVASLAARAEPAEIGRVLEDVKVRRIDGGVAPLFDRASSATVLVFFRPGHERSAEALQSVGQCRASLAGRPVGWLAVAPGESDVGEVKATLAAAKAEIPVVLDEGDALYAAVSVRTLPAVVVVDRARRIVASEGYHPVRYAEVVAARVRRAMGEISDADVAAALAPASSPLPGDGDPLGVARRHVNFGRKLLEAKAFAKAHESARKSLGIAPSAAAWALEGEIFTIEGKCAEAARSFDAALALDPREPVALAMRARCK